jgi:hypothetical protein
MDDNKIEAAIRKHILDARSQAQPTTDTSATDKIQDYLEKYWNFEDSLHDLVLELRDKPDVDPKQARQLLAIRAQRRSRRLGK